MMRRARARGFTMIEVMIAIVLLLVVATAAWKSFELTFGTKTRVTLLNERYHEGRLAVARMARELRMSFLRPAVPEALREEDPAVLTRFKGEEDEIYFPTTAHLRMRAGTRESDQSEVAYYLGRGDRDSGYRGQTLFRRESTRVDDDPEKGGTIWPVVEGVKEFRIEYWDDDNEIGDDAWKREWDSDDEDLLPARVRITLVLESGGDMKREIRFVTQAAPHIRRPINVIEAHVQPKTSAGKFKKSMKARGLDPKTGKPLDDDK